MSSKKYFDEVFGGSNKIRESDLPTERRGVPVRLSAFASYSVHRQLAKSYKSVTRLQEQLTELNSELRQAKWDFQMALMELEVNIYAQEKESGIRGTEYVCYKPLEDQGDDDERDEE